MELYKFELKIWLCFAVTVFICTTVLILLTEVVLFALLYLSAFYWDFADAKRIRDMELMQANCQTKTKEI